MSIGNDLQMSVEEKSETNSGDFYFYPKLLTKTQLRNELSATDGLPDSFVIDNLSSLPEDVRLFLAFENGVALYVQCTLSDEVRKWKDALQFDECDEITQWWINHVKEDNNYSKECVRTIQEHLPLTRLHWQQD